MYRARESRARKREQQIVKKRIKNNKRARIKAYSKNLLLFFYFQSQKKSQNQKISQ